MISHNMRKVFSIQSIYNHLYYTGLMVEKGLERGGCLSAVYAEGF